MKKNLVKTMAVVSAAAVVSTGFTVPVMADDPVEITIWSPTDEPAIEEWWVQKIDEFNKAHEGEIVLSREAIVRADSYAYEDKVNAARCV